MPDFWLREATAAFEDVLRREAEQGRPAARERLQVLRDSYLALRAAARDRPLAELGAGDREEPRDEGRGVSQDSGSLPSPLTPQPSSTESSSSPERGDRQVARTKGAWVLWMLRQAVGPLSFRAIWSGPGGPPTTTEALKEGVVSGEWSVLNSDSPDPTRHPPLTTHHWDSFFDFWVYSTGLPQYRLLGATVKGSAGAFVVTLKVTNRGTGAIPAPLVVQTEEGARHEFSLIVPGGGTSEVSYSMVTKPVAAAVDPEGDLLQAEPSGAWQAVKARRWF